MTIQSRRRLQGLDQFQSTDQLATTSSAESLGTPESYSGDGGHSYGGEGSGYLTRQDEDRRQRRRERNKVAATKCRNKKKEHTVKLAEVRVKDFNYCVLFNKYFLVGI